MKKLYVNKQTEIGELYEYALSTYHLTFVDIEYLKLNDKIILGYGKYGFQKKVDNISDNSIIKIKDRNGTLKKRIPIIKRFVKYMRNLHDSMYAKEINEEINKDIERCQSTNIVEDAVEAETIRIEYRISADVTSIDNFITSFLERTMMSDLIDGLEDVKVTLTEEQFGKLKTVNGSECNTSCSICMKNIRNDTNAIMLPCDHVFDKECIHKWLTECSNKCPNCRTEVIIT